MTNEDLVRLVDWKLTRGKWRPKLLDYAKQQEDGVVKEASMAAFEVRSSLEQLWLLAHTSYSIAPHRRRYMDVRGARRTAPLSRLPSNT